MLTTSHGEIEFNDGLRLTGEFHIPKNHSITIVFIANALGVLRRFNAKFSSYLAGKGFVTLTFDSRGCGDSPDRHFGAREFDLTMGKPGPESWPVERSGEVAEKSGENRGCNGAFGLNLHCAHQGNPAGESFRGDSHARF